MIFRKVLNGYFNEVRFHIVIYKVFGKYFLDRYMEMIRPQSSKSDCPAKKRKKVQLNL